MSLSERNNKKRFPPLPAHVVAHQQSQILTNQEKSITISSRVTRVFSLVLAGNPTTINSGSISSTTALANSDVIEVSNVGTLSDGTNLTARIVIESISGSAEYDPSAGTLGLNPHDARNDDFGIAIVHSIARRTNGPQTLVSVGNLQCHVRASAIGAKIGHWRWWR